jgi:hypothetical protein
LKRRCAQEDDVLGPAIYLSKPKAGAEFYGEGRGGKTLGPFYVRGNIVGPDTEVPYSFNPDGSVKKRAKAIHVLGWLRGQLTMGKREPGGEGMSPAEYARWFWKRRGVDGYAIEGGLEVAIYDPKNIRHAEAFDGQGAGSLGAPGEREDTGRGGTAGEHQGQEGSGSVGASLPT